MKNKVKTIVVIVLIGVAGYFTYQHFCGCKENCEATCESKDSTAVTTTPTVAVNDSTAVKDTTKK
jgi:hypothetical protein